MPRIGLPLWPHGRVEEELAEFWRAGADYVELSADYPWVYGLRLEEARALRRAVREWGMEIGVHAPWRDVHLASPLEEVRRASTELLTGPLLKLVEEVEAVYVNIHVSTEEALDAGIVRDAAERSAVESVRSLVSEYAPRGVVVTIENTPRRILGEASFIGRVLDAVPGAKLCLDVAHAYAYYARRNSGVSTEDALTHWLSMSDRIFLLHIHDAYRCGDKCLLEHVPPGTGEIDWEWVSGRLMRKASPEYVLIEAYRTPPGTRGRVDYKAVVEEVREWLG